MSSEQGKLQPIPLRREDDPNYEPEIWQPNWKCFCCEDTGLARHAAFKFIEGYILEKHKFPVCQRLGCEAGVRFGQSPALQYSLDWRLEGWMCEEADRSQREAWLESARQQQQRKRVVIDLSSIGKSLRKRSRTPEEEMLAQRKHLAVLAEMNGHSLNGTS